MILDPSNTKHYDIMAALRGPDKLEADYSDVHAKMLTTAVIRDFAGVTPSAGPYVVSPAYAIAEWNAFSDSKREEIKRFMRTNCHFHMHVYNAFRALEDIPEAARYFGWLLNKKIL